MKSWNIQTNNDLAVDYPRLGRHAAIAASASVLATLVNHSCLTTVLQTTLVHTMNLLLTIHGHQGPSTI